MSFSSSAAKAPASNSPERGRSNSTSIPSRSSGPQGSGILRSMVQADGLVFVPSGHAGGRVDDPYTVVLLEGSRPERPPFPS